MTDNTDAASAAVAPELKSTDTGLFSKAEKPAEPAKVEPKASEPEGDATIALEGADAPPADSPEKKEQRLPRWMKERLERERQVTEARTEARIRQEFAEKQPQVTKAPEPEAPKAKTLADFDFDQDAYFDYKVEQKLVERETAETRKAQEREQAKAAETFKARVDAFEERAGAGAWEDITTSPLNTDPTLKPLVDMFMGEEHDLDIAHYLASNPDELKRIAALTPLQKARELAKLVDSIGGESEAVNIPAPVIPRKLTTAPPPPRLVSGAGKPSVNIDDPKLSSEDRIKAWRAQGLSRRR